MNDDDPKLRAPVPLNRHQRRAMKGARMKLIEGGKRADAPAVDMSQPAGRFAFYLHEFIVRYFAANADLERTAACAAALQVAAKFAVELGGDTEQFAMAAQHFFDGEVQAGRLPGVPGPGSAG
jgi:hypothetical protein